MECGGSPGRSNSWPVSAQARNGKSGSVFPRTPWACLQPGVPKGRTIGITIASATAASSTLHGAGATRAIMTGGGSPRDVVRQYRNDMRQDTLLGWMHPRRLRATGSAAGCCGGGYLSKVPVHSDAILWRGCELCITPHASWTCSCAWSAETRSLALLSVSRNGVRGREPFPNRSSEKLLRISL